MMIDIKENRFAAWLTPEQQEALFEVTNIREIDVPVICRRFLT